VIEPQLIQGRWIGQQEIQVIRGFLRENPGWSRRRLSIALCEHFDWRSGTGALRDMSARLLLNKLADRGWIELPPRMHAGGARPPRALRVEPEDLFGTEAATPRDPIECGLADLRPVEIAIVPARSPLEWSFAGYLKAHHYLGYGGVAGQNIRYLFRDRLGRDLGCALFAGAAWKVQARDRFIGWEAMQRGHRLALITNNTRYLILPDVRVPHLASHVLGLLVRRLRADWSKKYGCEPVLAETFVERDRFAGTCYRAANWQCVGQTVARGRNDRFNRLQVPVKDVLLYPLAADFREVLCR
jgi:hypothetical protein